LAALAQEINDFGPKYCNLGGTIAKIGKSYDYCHP
jgi:hypothetical protein